MKLSGEKCYGGKGVIGNSTFGYQCAVCKLPITHEPEYTLRHVFRVRHDRKRQQKETQ